MPILAMCPGHGRTASELPSDPQPRHTPQGANAGWGGTVSLCASVTCGCPLSAVSTFWMANPNNHLVNCSAAGSEVSERP